MLYSLADIQFGTRTLNSINHFGGFTVYEFSCVLLFNGFVNVFLFGISLQYMQSPQGEDPVMVDFNQELSIVVSKLAMDQ